MSGTIIVLIMVPLWALGSGVLTNLAIISPRPETASEKFADSAMGCFGTVLWFVQIALMGMSTRLSWLAPLISVPASYVFFVLGRQIALDRTRQLDLLPFFETFVTIPVTS